MDANAISVLEVAWAHVQRWALRSWWRKVGRVNWRQQHGLAKWVKWELLQGSLHKQSNWQWTRETEKDRYGSNGVPINLTPDRAILHFVSVCLPTNYIIIKPRVQQCRQLAVITYIVRYSYLDDQKRDRMETRWASQLELANKDQSKPHSEWARPTDRRTDRWLHWLFPFHAYPI